jgi:hypothetical protein
VTSSGVQKSGTMITDRLLQTASASSDSVEDISALPRGASCHVSASDKAAAAIVR